MNHIFDKIIRIFRQFGTSSIYALPVCIAALYLASAPSAHAIGKQPIDSLMQTLDTTIKHRGEYSARKEAELDALQHELDTARTDDARFDRLGALFDAYLSYDADSAIAAAVRREEVGIRTGSQEKILNARLNLANILSLTGSYTEALDIIKQIHLKDLPDYLYPYYFYIKRLTYGNMADYAVRESDREYYRRLTAQYRDSLLAVNDRETWTWSLIKGDTYNETGQYEQAIATLDAYLASHEVSTHEEAIFAYTLSEAYRKLGDRENEKRYLLISAINDLRSGVREYVSPRKLALILYEEGDIERAYQLMRICLADATSSNSRQRIFEINEDFPLVNEMYVSTIRSQQHRLRNMLVLIGVLLLILAVALFFVYKQMKRARNATRLANEANTELRRLNDELHRANAKLHQANADIAEHSYVKTEYIGRYMEQCLQNIDALAAYRKQLRILLAGGKIDKVAKTLDSDTVLDEAFKTFYNDFDKTFLKLFPTFINDFNNLLEPDGRIVPKQEGTLNTELRIYALIRLGITDSAKIAKFLRYSVTTIYNYRTRVRNRAIGDRSKLEEMVANIGR